MLMAANQTGETTSVDFGTEEICDEIWIGAPLIGHTTDRKIVNGAILECKGWTAKTIKILDVEAGNEIEIPREATKHLRVGYAITYAAVQGRTLRESVRLWDTAHRNYTVRHLSMALGRAVSPDLIDLG